MKLLLIEGQSVDEIGVSQYDKIGHSLEGT